MLVSSLASITIPDTRIVDEATELVRDAASELLFHHSRRVFYFGALQGRRKQIAYDAELLYVGAMFHDLGLTTKYGSTDKRFEIDGADEARKFLSRHGVPEDSIRVVWEAIALHTTPEIPHHMGPEIALVTAGVELDVLGIGFHDISDDERAAVVAEHPRPDFKNQILHAFNNGISHRQHTAFGNVKADVLERFSADFKRANFVEIIESSDWPE